MFGRVAVYDLKQIIDTDDFNNLLEDDDTIDELTLSGLINNKYKIEMYLSISDRKGWYRYLKTGSGDKINLEIEDLKETIQGQYLMSLREYVNGESTGYFEGTLSLDDGITEPSTTYVGTFTNYKGTKMGFDLKATDK